MIGAKEADMLVQNNENKEHISQQEYIRGVSVWNFNLEDIKNQAATIQDNFMSNPEDSSMSMRHIDGQEEEYFVKADHSKDDSQLKGELSDLYNMEGSLAVFPMKPLEALKGCFDIGSGRKNFSSGSLVQCNNNVLSPKKFISDGDSKFLEAKCGFVLNEGNICNRDIHENGIIVVHCSIAKRKILVLGRMTQKVLLSHVEDVLKSLQAQGPMNFNTASGGSTSPVTPTTASFLPSLQCMLQHNTAQREELLELIKLIEQTSGQASEATETGMIGPSQLLQITPTTIKERELQTQVIQLQQSVGSLVDEHQRLRMKNSQVCL